MRSVLFTPVSLEMALSSLGVHAAVQGLAPCMLATLSPEGHAVIGNRRAHLGNYDCIFVSVAWELELADLARALARDGIAPFSLERPDSDPLLVGGGPITLSNPQALAAICDVVFVGDADGLFGSIRTALEGAKSRHHALESLGEVAHAWVPALAEKPEAPSFRCPDEPVHSIVSGPNCFGDAFLVEVSRGCPVDCTFCVVRGKNRRPFFFDVPKVVRAIPQDASRVGLVGAAVSLHPRLLEIVRRLTEREVCVTLSSIRADRASAELLSLLASSGLRTFTTAADGLSERLRRMVRKHVTSADLLQAAKNAKLAGFRQMRLYLMTGLPTEGEADLREGAELIGDMSSLLPLTVSVSPFVPKMPTPLCRGPFVGISELRRRIRTLRKLLAKFKRVRVSAHSPAVARTEWELSCADRYSATAILRRMLNARREWRCAATTFSS